MGPKKYPFDVRIFHDFPSTIQLLGNLHLAMDQYLLIPFLGDEDPFTSYFDVH